METMQILAQALVDIKRVYESTTGNDAAFRKQCRIILNAPALNYSIARARDAPAEQAETPKPAKKRTTKPKQTPVND